MKTTEDVEKRGFVRRGVEGDIPAIMELLRQVNLVHYKGRPDLFNPETKYTEEELREVLSSEDTPVFVYESADGKVLGHGFCIFERPGNLRLLKDHVTLYIDDICVDESARGENIGRAIYEHIRAFAREKGCYNITLNVWSCNPGARRFYEKLGLVPYKTGMEELL